MAYQSPTESPPPQRGPEGFVLTVSHSQHYAGVYLCAFGFIGTAFSTFMLMAVLREPFGFFGLFPATFIHSLVCLYSLEFLPWVPDC